MYVGVRADTTPGNASVTYWLGGAFYRVNAKAVIVATQSHSARHILTHVTSQAAKDAFESFVSVPVVVANVSRRRFLQGATALGGLVLAVGFASAARAAAPRKYGADNMPNGWVDDPLAFVSIADDGTVTIVCHRSEMGQGVRTGMPMIVADELEADWKRVRVAQAPGDEKRFGNQDTDGSRSMRHHFAVLRSMGAAARTMLEQAAAKQWNVPADQVAAQNHEVVHAASGRKLGFGALAKAAAICAASGANEINVGGGGILYAATVDRAWRDGVEIAAAAGPAAPPPAK